MAKFDYVAARAVAEKLIKQFGQNGDFTVKGSGGGGYDDFGNVIPAQPDTFIPAVITPILSYKKHEIDNETILASDGYIFAYTDVDSVPVDSRITINSDTYRVIDNVNLTSVDDIVVYTKYQLRK